MHIRPAKRGILVNSVDPAAQFAKINATFRNGNTYLFGLLAMTPS